VNWNSPVIMRWLGTDEELWQEPFLGWNDVFLPMWMRGQIWDAVVRTRYAPFQTPVTFDSLPFFVYSDGFNGSSWYQTGDIHSLCLRDPGLTTLECDAEPPAAAEESNYVY